MLTVIVFQGIKLWMFNRSNCSISKNLQFPRIKLLKFKVPYLYSLSSDFRYLVLFGKTLAIFHYSMVKSLGALYTNKKVPRKFFSIWPILI